MLLSSHVLFWVSDSAGELLPAFSSTMDAVLTFVQAASESASTASIVLENAGNSSPAESLTQNSRCDDRSKIQFNDPFDEMPDLNLMHCTGVFAVGGFCASAATKKVSACSTGKQGPRSE